MNTLKMIFFSAEMEVFTVGKRENEFHHWEPIFIGTHTDPLYDERLSWEGQADKMTHVRKVEMCSN